LPISLDVRYAESRSYTRAMGAAVWVHRLASNDFCRSRSGVTNVERSARWYAQLLDMGLAMEFVEDDQLRGVVLVEPVTGVRICLLDRAFCSSHPVLDGFDLIAFEMTSLPALEEFARGCQELGIRTSGVH
jgi:hypothetical protein